MLTLAEAELHFDVTRRTLGRWRKSGAPGFEQIDGRWHVTNPEALAAWRVGGASTKARGQASTRTNVARPPADASLCPVEGRAVPIRQIASITVMREYSAAEDRLPGPKPHLEVIEGARISELSAAGGALPYLSNKYGPGAYVLTYNGWAMDQLRTMRVEVPDLERIRQAIINRSQRPATDHRRLQRINGGSHAG